MRVLYVTGLIVLVDQISKLLVKGFEIPVLDLYHAGVPVGASYPILGDFLRLTFIENPGMAFGIDMGGKLFLTVFSLVASAAIFAYLYKIRGEAIIIRIALAMILGGAIGNLIDRVFYGVIFGESPLFYGKVVDFVDVDFFDIDFLGIHLTRFPVFNLADASVSVGVATLLLFHRRFTEAERAEVTLSSSGSVGPPSNPASPGATVGNMDGSSQVKDGSQDPPTFTP
ncbi:MAG: signal peptidase II [Ignavibacteria bacterium]|nr:signal peptidase II [Ignavibacteria bacterium]